MENKKIGSIKAKKTSSQSIPKKGCFNFRNCCLSCLGLFLLFIVLGLILLSLSGVVWIPGLSNLLYGSGPEPLRRVEFSELPDKYVEKKMEDAKKSGQEKIIFSEEELTYFLNKYAVENAKAKDKEEASGQVVIENNFAEAYLHKTRGFRDAIFWVYPTEDGKVKVEKIRIGKIPVPAFVGNLILGSFMRSFSGSGQNILEDYEIKLREGEVEMNVEPYLFDKNKDKPPLPNLD